MKSQVRSECIVLYTSVRYTETSWMPSSPDCVTPCPPLTHPNKRFPWADESLDGCMSSVISPTTPGRTWCLSPCARHPSELISSATCLSLFSGLMYLPRHRQRCIITHLVLEILRAMSQSEVLHLVSAASYAIRLGLT